MKNAHPRLVVQLNQNQTDLSVQILRPRINLRHPFLVQIDDDDTYDMCGTIVLPVVPTLSSGAIDSTCSTVHMSGTVVLVPSFLSTNSILHWSRRTTIILVEV